MKKKRPSWKRLLHHFRAYFGLGEEQYAEIVGKKALANYILINITKYFEKKKKKYGHTIFNTI